MNKNEQLLKNQLIHIIENSEKLAFETYSISVKQDLFSIKQKASKPEIEIKLTLEYFARTINDYHATKNFYKAAGEQFQFLNIKLAETKINDNDRVDFIAMIYLNLLKNESPKKTESKQQAILQFNDLENIVYETKLSELKAKAFEQKFDEVENLQNKVDTETKNTQPFNSNHFNQKANDLFLFLIDKYDKKGKIKFINIFEFMKKDIDKIKYVFRFTQETYKNHIVENYNTQIRKFATAEYGYKENEKPLLNSFVEQFEKQYLK